MTVSRLVLLAAVLCAARIYIDATLQAEPVMLREPLSTLPQQVGGWRARPAPAFDDRVLRQLGVDEYVNRIYAAGRMSAGVYIGYYGSQRQGDTIHSPLNCLPGSGWQALDKRPVEIPVADAHGRPLPAPLRVTELTVQKADDAQLVLYWYQSHGRTVANEYALKVFTVIDAVRYNRTDGAMIRVMTATSPGATDERARARASLVSLVQSMFPLLERHLPGLDAAQKKG